MNIDTGILNRIDGKLDEIQNSVSEIKVELSKRKSEAEKQEALCGVYRTNIENDIEDLKKFKRETESTTKMTKGEYLKWIAGVTVSLTSIFSFIKVLGLI